MSWLPKGLKTLFDSEPAEAADLNAALAEAFGSAASNYWAACRVKKKRAISTAAFFQAFSATLLCAGSQLFRRGGGGILRDCRSWSELRMQS